MKNVIVLIFLFVGMINVNGQVKKTPPNPYKNLIDIESLLRYCDISNSIHALSVKFGGEGKDVPGSKTIELLGPLLKVLENGDLTQKAQFKYLTKYRTSVNEYLNGLSNFGEEKANVIIYDSEVFHLGFTTFKSSLSFYQTGIFYNYSLNTLKLNPNERALKVATDVGLPALYNFKNLNSIPEIKYFTVIVSFLAKDFSNDDSDTETIALIVSREYLHKYLKAEITDEDILKSSILYSINKATGTNIKKISTQ